MSLSIIYLEERKENEEGRPEKGKRSKEVINGHSFRVEDSPEINRIRRM